MARLESGDVFTNFDNLTGHVATEDMRQFHSRDAFANPQIEVIHRACFDANEYLVFAWLRIRDVLVAENFRPTEFVNANGFHVG